MNLRRFDLNLLPILKALLTTHSVARASETLGLSQSATSGALSRLRLMFADPLLVLVGRNLVPTPYAEELVPLLDSALGDLHALLDRRTFVPREERRCFVICSSDYAIDDIGPPLIALLAEEAPHVSVRFIEISTQHRASMISGEIDFLISPQNVVVTGSEDFHSTPLYEDEMIIISSDTFPMPEDGLDLETYLAADHAAYGVSDGDTFEQWALGERQLKQRNVVTIPQFIPLPRYVASAKCLAMVPRHVAERHVSTFKLHIWPVPFDIPKMRVSIHWSHALNRNPAHVWFRSQIAKAWAQSQPDASASSIKRLPLQNRSATQPHR